MNNRRFVKQGDRIVVKEDIKPIELDSKAVIENLEALRGNIDKTKNQLSQLEKQKEQMITVLEDMQESMKNLGKHKEWATEIQMSKIKSLIEVCQKDAVEKVLSTYEYDEVLTPEQNLIQMRHQVQAFTGRDPRMAEAIAPTMIQAHVYVRSMLPSLWNDVKTVEDVQNLLKK